MAALIVVFLSLGKPLMAVAITPAEIGRITEFRPYPNTYSSNSDPGISRSVRPSERQGLSPYGPRPSPLVGSGNVNYWRDSEPSVPYFEYQNSEDTNQTDSESFLMPNPWNGLMPWGAESITLYVVVLAVVLVPIAAIIFLIVSLVKFVKTFRVLSDADNGGNQTRSYIPSFIETDVLHHLTSDVLNALDMYTMN